MNIYVYEDQSALSFDPISTTRATFDIRIGAETFLDRIKILFPDAIIRYVINKKKQEMVDGWPMDTNDSAAKDEWNWRPNHNLDKGLNEYLIPDLKKMYS